jgi:hypothetical protein
MSQAKKRVLTRQRMRRGIEELEPEGERKRRGEDKGRL